MSAVPIHELLADIKRRRARLPAEIGAFIALLALDRLEGRHLILSPAHISVTPEGEVGVDANAGEGTAREAAKAMIDVLGHLLVAAGSGVSPMMLALVEGAPPDDKDVLQKFRDALEASLVPLNYGASRRVLARLVREQGRAGTGITPTKTEDAGQLDAGVDALLDGRDEEGADPQPPKDEAEPVVQAGVAEVHENRAELGEQARAAEAGERTSSVDRLDSYEEEVGREALGAARDLRQMDRGSRPWELSPTLLVVVILTAAIGTAYALGWFERGGAEALDEVSEPAAADPAAVVVEEASARGDIIVRGSPVGAEVFRYVGTSPVTVDDIAVGRAEEFLLLADGRAPGRAVVPRDAAWAGSANAPELELAIQAGNAQPEQSPLTLGESRVQGDRGVRGDRVGRVRVVTNPPGGQVYRWVGRMPNVRIRGVRTGDEHALIVGAPGRRAQRVRVGVDQWREVAGTMVSEVEVQLDALP